MLVLISTYTTLSTTKNTFNFVTSIESSTSRNSETKTKQITINKTLSSTFTTSTISLVIHPNENNGVTERSQSGIRIACIIQKQRRMLNDSNIIEVTNVTVTNLKLCDYIDGKIGNNHKPSSIN